jgi:hypothetical protein
MLENLGNIGDFLGGIGVVITLIYLAVQIRQNTRQLRSDSAAAQTRSLEGTNTDISKWIGGIVAHRDVAELWAKGLNDIESLDATDRLRFDYLGMQLLQAWQAVYRRTTHADDPELWDVTLTFVRLYFKSPGFQVLWGGSKSLLMPDFVSSIERSNGHLINQGSEAPSAQEAATVASA